MWAPRRASIYLRNRGLFLGSSRILKSEIPTCNLDKFHAGFVKHQEKLFDGLLSAKRFYNTSSIPSKLFIEVRTFSSQAGPKSSTEDDDDLENGFSELETPCDLVQEATCGDEKSDELISESQLSEEEGVADDIQIELEALGTEIDVAEKRSPRTKYTMTKVILAAPALSLNSVLNKWVEEGNEVSKLEVALSMLELRKRRMYYTALQLLEWLESTKHLDFLEYNYASRVDLIAKVHGLFKAESYIELIPESFKGEVVYRTLLANCVSAQNVKKSEEVFNKMKNLGLQITCFSYNQLLLLYKRADKKKIADVLLLMEKENIKPSHFTYQILIDVKGQSNDIYGMEQIVETMKEEGVKPNISTLVCLARHYTDCGEKDKAETVLKEIEGDDIRENRRVCRFLLPIYASLGREDEVGRLWKVCESNPGWEECMAAIEAWGCLRKFENAEAAFETMVKNLKKPSSKHFSALLKVYANNSMLAKGKDLVKRMGESGCTIGPVTWDALVKLYVNAGEVEKAVAILENAAKKQKSRPLCMSYCTIMNQYARIGDIHNAEKLFLKMRQAGYVPRFQQYQSLLQAYVNAKAPAYGFSERMKADNVFPNKTLAKQLARVNSFKKSVVDELLE